MPDKDHSIIGKELGHYRILKKIGSGGMGEVYLAEDTKLGRKIALKVLPSQLAEQPDRRRRFEQEAKAVAALNHPNIVTVFSVENADGVHFITMEWVQGGNLSRLIPPKGLDLGRFLQLAVPIAEALGVAHQKGIVHRDLKPDNIMLADDGRVKILDFGLAKLIQDAVEPDEHAETGSVSPMNLSTREGVIVGTVAYMSPEQAEGKPLDQRSDIFSLGVIFYEMLTGILPFQGDSAASVISAILRDTPRPVLELNPSLPHQVGKIIRRCLAKDLTRRHQSALDIRNELEELSEEIGSGVLTTTRIESTVSGVSRKSRLSFVIMFTLLAAAGITGYVLLRNKPVSEKAPVVHNITQITTAPGQELFPSLSPDGKSVVYESHVSGNWDIYLQRASGKNPNNLTQDSKADDTQASFSPDGEHIVFRSERDGGGIFTMGSTGESVLRLTDFGYNPAWSFNSKDVVFATERITQPLRGPTVSQLWTVSVADGSKRLVSKEDGLQPSYSPHGYRIAYWGRTPVTGKDDIWTLPAGGGPPVAVTNDAALDWNPVWSPDGKYLYFCSDRTGSMNIWRASIDEKTGRVVGEPQQVTTGAAASSQHLSVSQDGKLISYVARFFETKNLERIQFDPSSGSVQGQPSWLTQGSRMVSFPEPSPDGQWLAYSSEGKQPDIFLIKADGSGLRQLTDDPHEDRAPRWSPDGKTIAFFSNRSGKYEIWGLNPDGSDLRQLSSNPGAHYPVWSPDGKRMAYSDHSPNGNFVFPLGESGNKEFALPSLPDTTQTFEAWSWSGDGNKLAGIRHLANGAHVGVGFYSFESKKIEWLTDFGEWPIWLNDSRNLLFFSDGKIFLVDTQSKKYREVISVTPERFGAFGVSKDNRLLFVSVDTSEADVWLITLK